MSWRRTWRTRYQKPGQHESLIMAASRTMRSQPDVVRTRVRTSSSDLTVPEHIWCACALAPRTLTGEVPSLNPHHGAVLVIVLRSQPTC